MAHVVVGTSTGSPTVTEMGDVANYLATTYLVQTGVAATATDAFDIAAIVHSTGTTAAFANAAAAQAATVVNLTGTIGADSLTGGVNNDTISGGDGADSIVGGVGGDSFVGGAGNDTYLIGNGDTGVISWTGTAYTAASTVDATNLDKITFLIGDTLKFDPVTTSLSATLGTVNTVPGDGKISLVRGDYTAAVATTGVSALFTQSTTGASTMVVYDSDTSVTNTSYRAVILVGYVDTDTGTTAGAAGTADTYAGTVTGLVGTA